MHTNIICLADSYKYSHWKQYPEKMVQMFDYAEARTGKVYPASVFFGLQYYIKKYLMKPITLRDIYQAHDLAKEHGVPFNLYGWMHILNQYDGYLPVKIKAVKEGTLVPTQNVLFTIESTDRYVPWVAGFLETLLLKVWYPSNIATRSYYVKKLIQRYWDFSVDESEMFGINFSFHNFGDRGSSSTESAGIGGMAHLTQFLGTDNFDCLRYAKHFYDEPMAGFSIPATEHSSTTAWEKDNELEMIMNHIETNKGAPIVAAVCDSYDYLATVKAVTSGEFKEIIESPEYPKFIIRPDSGDPVEMINATLDIMIENKVEYVVNKKGYIVFKKYGIIWGDGINSETIEAMLVAVTSRGFSASNISFGSGGWLMQDHDRDTQGWAVKCSSITVDEGSPIDDGNGGCVWEDRLIKRDVYKDPITAKNKKSKKGEITLWFDKDKNEFFTDDRNIKNRENLIDMLEVVYENGTCAENSVQTLSDIREKTKG